MSDSLTIVDEFHRPVVTHITPGQLLTDKIEVSLAFEGLMPPDGSKILGAEESGVSGRLPGGRR